jgi:hypothetical protein
MSLRRLVVDVHTHLYLPRYASVLRSRSAAPRILTRDTPSGQSEDRLLILDDEPSGGRPVGPQVPSHIQRIEEDNDMRIVLGQRREAQVHGPTWDRHIVRQASRPVLHLKAFRHLTLCLVP